MRKESSTFLQLLLAKSNEEEVHQIHIWFVLVYLCVSLRGRGGGGRGNMANAEDWTMLSRNRMGT